MRVLPSFEEKIRHQIRDELARTPVITMTALKERIENTFGRGFDYEYVRRLVGKVRELNEGVKPEWHHIFPRKILREKDDESKIDSLANIAVLNEKANKSFGAKPPAKYLEENGVKPERLQEQEVPPKKRMRWTVNGGRQHNRISLICAGCWTNPARQGRCALVRKAGCPCVVRGDPINPLDALADFDPKYIHDGLLSTTC
jgi:hypothetical protein